MKKIFILPVIIISIISCSQQSSNTQSLQNQIDSLQEKLSQVYKPGFGEFMGYIQAHHEKLWYAGQHENWKLAGFEMDEIKETFENIQKYETDRPETKLLPMIKASLDSVTTAIGQQNPAKFKNSFTMLTNTCNTCHLAAKFEFNVVKIPDMQTFSNQDFKPAQ